jgi:hypothetical protein
MGQGRDVVRQTIGLWLSGLLPVQAAWMLGRADPWTSFAIALLVAWPLHRLVARRFYAS